MIIEACEFIRKKRPKAVMKAEYMDDWEKGIILKTWIGKNWKWLIIDSELQPVKRYYRVISAEEFKMDVGYLFPKKDKRRRAIK